MEAGVFCNPISEVSPITFAIFYSFRSKLLGLPHAQGEGITQGHYYQERGSLGVTLEAAPCWENVVLRTEAEKGEWFQNAEVVNCSQCCLKG